jgi:hypothetical protein
MKTVKAWALVHKATGKIDAVWIYRTRAWFRKHYSQVAWALVRVEIRELPRKPAQKGK